ncbi:MAG TPA: glycerophosphodiester phosphodiesterase family protein, partial [Gemmatimonadaceae bacterium]|nr:glycerophosphodiester phosphodiesterase family protein [Gemmatimonadaceae bacterium]
MASNPLLDPDARLVIAHRGNRVAAPENTIPALRQALDMGVDALEFDVRMTRDDVAVVIHDATVDRTTNGAGRVDAYDLASLRALDAGARCVGAARTHIPTLEEVFDAFRDTPLVIEIKELAALDATLALIRRFGVEHRVVVGSAENAVMERLYRSGLP